MEEEELRSMDYKMGFNKIDYLDHWSWLNSVILCIIIKYISNHIRNKINNLVRRPIELVEYLYKLLKVINKIYSSMLCNKADISHKIFGFLTGYLISNVTVECEAGLNHKLV